MEEIRPVAEEVLDVDAELNAEVLEILGDDVASPEKLLGLALQREVATRWLGVIKMGLSEEERQKHVTSYPIPTNCPLLAAPKLNLEVTAAVNEFVSRRDTRMAKIQNQIGASLSAIGQVISPILREKEGGHLTYIKQLSEASRMLLDLHHQETNTRRDLASLNLNKELRSTFNNASVDGWLFGADLEERVKATKTLEKSGEELKASKPKASIKRSNVNRQLNYRSLPRLQQGVRQGERNQLQTPRPQPQTSRNQYQGSRNQYHHRSNDRDRRAQRGRMGTHRR